MSKSPLSQEFKRTRVVFKTNLIELKQKKYSVLNNSKSNHLCLEHHLYDISGNILAQRQVAGLFSNNRHFQHYKHKAKPVKTGRIIKGNVST